MTSSSASVFLVLILSSLVIDPALQCAPGNGYGSRRPHRKQRPLMYKQSVPKLSESSLGASGVSEGAIERTSSRFQELVVNNNPEVVFKDGVENARMMSQRCKDRVNSLAVLVRNRWPGIRLRVIKAWDEAGDDLSSHRATSLHPDGRAVDITTNDRDREKLGALAALAVDAGFDWVYYETRGHVHCSVQSDSSITSRIGGCFSGEEFVHLANGTEIIMSRLSIGDRVLTIDENGQPAFDRVIGFLHRSPNSTAMFVRLETEGGSISLTPDHLVFSGVISRPKVVRATYAGTVEVGQLIYRLSSADGDLEPLKVTRVSYVSGQGLYAPLTSHGTIVVGGYVASCYGVVSSQSLAHAALWPMRFMTSWTNQTDALDSDGVHWYPALLRRIFVSILPTKYWYPT